MQARTDWYCRTHRTASLEARREYDRRWKRNNRDKCSAKEAAREAAKLQRTPTLSDLDAITELYDECARLNGMPHARLPGEEGDTLAVDHIVPLRGRNVSGLHVPANLRIVRKRAISSKNNKLPAEHASIEGWRPPGE